MGSREPRLDPRHVAFAFAFVAMGCGDHDQGQAPSSAPIETAAPIMSVTETASATAYAAPPPPPPPKPACPSDMVRVEPHPKSGEPNTPAIYCVDRYEGTVIDQATSKPASPYYPPDPNRSSLFERIWRDKMGSGTAIEKAMPLPQLPGWEKKMAFVPVAVSVEGAIPQAYANEVEAGRACKNAGKRLCTMDEWRAACRGEDDRDFPYGDKYEAGQCNIVGPAHPGVILWEDASINHTDPRFNLVKYKGQLLLRRTGATKTCVSKWGDDGIYDMNGNIDEWVDDEKGMFLGGFYARGKKDGCKSRVTAHPPLYSDYTTGIRCCRAADVDPPSQP